MDLKKIIYNLINLIPKDLLKNKNFSKMKELLLSNIYNTDNYEIKLSNDIYRKINNNKKNITLNNNKYNQDLIFSFECKDIPYIRFTIYKNTESQNKEYIINLRKTKEGEYLTTDKNLELLVKNNHCKWKKIESLIDDNCYYYDFDCKILKCDNNLNEINKKKTEQEANNWFISIFNTPLDITPKLRQNFKKYRELINEYRIKSIMKSTDEFFLKNNNGINFDGALNFDIFKDAMLNIDFDGEIDEDLYYQEDYEEEELLEEELEYLNKNNDFIEENNNLEGSNIDEDKLNIIEKNLINQIGYNSEFIISHNIILNLYNYLYRKTSNIISTSGILINKINDKYTLYYIHIEYNKIITIPKNMTKSQAKQFYKEQINNKNKERIKEFFGIDHSKGKYLK